MPPPKKRDVAVVLFDLKMDRNISIGILKEVILHNSIRNNNNNRLRLILLNSSESNNPMDFTHIRELTKEVPYTLDAIPCIERAEAADADWLEGIELAATVLSDYYEQPGVFTLQLIFITDLATPLINTVDKEERVSKVISLLRDSFIYLYVIGLDTESALTIKSKDDVRRYMKKLVFKNSEFDGSENRELATKIVRQAEGIMCPPELAIDFLTFYVNNIPKPGWLVPLTFEGFEFPTITKRIIAPEALVKMKRNAPKTRTWTAVATSADDEIKVVRNDQTVDCYNYLDKIIPLPDDVKESFKFQGSRMFKLVGFVDTHAIPELYMGGEEAHSVNVDPSDPKAEPFYQLVQSTHRKEKYGLALRVYNNNNTPKLYILIPQPPHQFLMVPHCELVDEMCYLSNPKKESLDESNELTKKFSDYLNELSTSVPPLHPNVSVGPFYHQYLKNMLHQIDPIANKDDEIPMEENDTETLKVLQHAIRENRKESQGDTGDDNLDDDFGDDW